LPKPNQLGFSPTFLNFGYSPVSYCFGLPATDERSFRGQARRLMYPVSRFTGGSKPGCDENGIALFVRAFVGDMTCWTAPVAGFAPALYIRAGPRHCDG
jgi:hypothetical protein